MSSSTTDDRILMEMDLVNRPNPWLPAYGFQITPGNGVGHHYNLQPTHEDLRANEMMQGDFLETILEETSDDLQSDSDRSGTTYWLGSDSETESVIHIKAGQRATDGERQDGSGSECNSVVPKKRRRKNNESSAAHATTTNSSGGGGDGCSSSGNSSRSSSLLQFESLERTCATSSSLQLLQSNSSPFDSLESQHTSRNSTSNNRRELAASPDSLEASQDYSLFNGSSNLRPCRSFESLSSDKEHRGASLSLANGYAYGKNCDLSRLASRPRSRRRDLWHLKDVDNNSSDYSDDRHEDSSSNLSNDEEEEEDFSPSRYTEVDQLLVFGVSDPTSGYSASVDCRNSVDLRDFGLDSDDERTRRESTLLDLKSGLYDSADELSDYDDIDPSVQLRRPRRRHHHHHHHPHRHHHHRSGSSSNSLQYVETSGARQSGGGASFNFRFADKWRSAPSLPASLLESAASSSAAVDVVAQAASVPVSLELCGRDDDDDDHVCLKLTDNEEEEAVVVAETEVEPIEDEEEQDDDDMAKIAATMNHDCGIPEDHDIEPGKMIGEEKARQRKRAKELQASNSFSSVKTQAAQSGILMTPSKVRNEDEIQNVLEDKPVAAASTVKTQDRTEKDVMEIAIAMENDVDEAIRQLTKEVEQANSSGNMTNVEELTAALESAQQMKQGLRRQRAKKNASYELAQQWNVDESNVKRKYRDLHPSIEEVEPTTTTTSPRPRRPLNNASYELAQQHDWMKNLSFGFGKHIYRMDACEELPEPCGSSTLRVSDIVEEMTGSASNLVSDSREPVPEMKCFAKSTENVNARKPAPRRQAPLEETSLLDQLKKNSDSPCAGGDATASSDNANNSKAVATLDDEVDYPCLLETKPIVAAMCTETSYLSSPSPRYSRSCEDVQWRKESRREQQQQPPPQRHTAAAANAAVDSHQSTLDSALLASSSGSPAASASAYNEQQQEASTVPRHNEMSATAAKRLALSGEPAIRTTSSMNALNTAGEKEKKKSGFGGFLQRFSKLRFSGRSKVPSSEVRKKGAANGAVPNSMPVQVRKKNEPDYVIIPLHPPADEVRRDEETRRQQQDVERNVSTSNGRPPVYPISNNNSSVGVVSSKKPPLPPGSLRGQTLSSSSSSSGQQQPRRRAATDLGNPAAIEMAKSRMLEQRPYGLLETDLDAPDEEAAAKKARSLLNLQHTSPHPNSHQHTNGHHHHRLQVETTTTLNEADSTDDVTTTTTTGNNGHSNHHHHHHHHHHHTEGARPHKSMEFLLDKENLHFVKPPENELQKVGERTPSEHELRVQRSLQRLNVPDWYKNSPAARDSSVGFRLKRHSDASQHATGWRALGSKTTSLSSLSSSSNRQPSTGVTNQNNVFDGEALLSPSPTPPVFSRWSTSLLNSAGSSPANSARSSFNHRQPYLGWRSQERLANPRTPAERLAQGILPQLQSAKQQQQQQQQNSSGNNGTTTTTTQPANQEVRNSIKEVTSAIVHYVQSGQELAGGRLSPRDWEDPARSGARSTSPRGSTRLVWMESSFVGVRPVDSPDVPAVAATSPTCSNRLASPSPRLLEMSLRPTSTTTTMSAGETSEEGGSTPGVQWPPSDDAGFASGGSMHLELEDVDHRHRQRRHHHRRDSQPQQQQAATAGNVIVQATMHPIPVVEDYVVTAAAAAVSTTLWNKPSPGSTTLEDVLDSLLGLPSASRTPSPGPTQQQQQAVARH